MYVADHSNGRIEVFSNDGKFLSKWDIRCGNGEPQSMASVGVAIDGQGNVFIADGGNGRVCEFDSRGRFLSTWGSQGAADGQFIAATGIALDRQNNIYVSDHVTNSIQKFRLH